MSTARVRAILGKPDQIETGEFHRWRYLGTKSCPTIESVVLDFKKGVVTEITLVGLEQE